MIICFFSNLIVLDTMLYTSYFSKEFGFSEKNSFFSIREVCVLKNT